MEPSEAQKKVFNTPEVVERLISFLDPEAIFCLAESHLVDKDTLRKSLGSKAWNQLIRRSSHGANGELEDEEDVKVLMKILKMIEVEEPSKFILPLLDQICKSKPVGDQRVYMLIGNCQKDTSSLFGSCLFDVSVL